MRRLFLMLSVAAAVTATAGCMPTDPFKDLDTSDFFIPGTEAYIVGPKLAAGQTVVTMHVGDTATLYLHRWTITQLGEHLRDTVRTVDWSTTDSVSAVLRPGPSGSGLLVAVKVGRVGPITAVGHERGQTFQISAFADCIQVGAGRSCRSVSVDVIPR